MTLYLNIIQIIVSVALIALVILQGRGGGMSGLFGGGGGGVYRTRRGVEKTVFNLTIILAVVFFVISLVSVLVS